jgi:hypothetical protein
MSLIMSAGMPGAPAVARVAERRVELVCASDWPAITEPARIERRNERPICILKILRRDRKSPPLLNFLADQGLGIEGPTYAAYRMPVRVLIELRRRLIFQSWVCRV